MPSAAITTPWTPFAAGAAFVNLSSNEYQVNLNLPVDAFCTVAGLDGDPVYGFASSPGSVRAPVLEGYVTRAIVARCRCPRSLDWATCAPPPDAVAPWIDAPRSRHLRRSDG